MIKYLNHELCEFNFITDKNGGRFNSVFMTNRYICNKCEVIVYKSIYTTEKRFFISSSSKTKKEFSECLLKITCNEIIIESIIE